MPTYRLTGQHYIKDCLLEEGMLVGEGTDFPLPDGYLPTDQMEAVSAETPESFETAKEMVKRAKAKSAGVQIDALPATVSGARQ